MSYFELSLSRCNQVLAEVDLFLADSTDFPVGLEPDVAAVRLRIATLLKEVDRLRGLVLVQGLNHSSILDQSYGRKKPAARFRLSRCRLRLVYKRIEGRRNWRVSQSAVAQKPRLRTPFLP